MCSNTSMAQYYLKFVLRRLEAVAGVLVCMALECSDRRPRGAYRPINDRVLQLWVTLGSLCGTGGSGCVCSYAGAGDDGRVRLMQWKCRRTVCGASSWPRALQCARHASARSSPAACAATVASVMCEPTQCSLAHLEPHTYVMTTSHSTLYH